MPPRFILAQRDAQSEFFARSVPPDAVLPGAGWRLRPEFRALNLAPPVRQSIEHHFRINGIVWHRHADHGLSSQVCCINFLAPLATRPDLLARVIGRALGIEPPTMCPVEDGPDGRQWFVGFEWTGRADYLGEWARGSATRGANATSADAIVRFWHGSRIETVLIEWKYTESYGAPLPEKGNETRRERYGRRLFHPDGPVRPDLGLSLDDFFWEPLYQLARQQMLAWRMSRAREDGAERVRVLHISPLANRRLHRVTSPALHRFGEDVFSVFRGLLIDPELFVARTTEDVFGEIVQEDRAEPGPEWPGYVRDRYGSILGVA